MDGRRLHDGTFKDLAEAQRAATSLEEQARRSATGYDLLHIGQKGFSTHNRLHRSALLIMVKEFPIADPRWSDNLGFHTFDTDGWPTSGEVGRLIYNTWDASTRASSTRIMKILAGDGVAVGVKPEVGVRGAATDGRLPKKAGRRCKTFITIGWNGTANTAAMDGC